MGYRFNGSSYVGVVAVLPCLVPPRLRPSLVPFGRAECIYANECSPPFLIPLSYYPVFLRSFKHRHLRQ
jgi:hypothetical protein